MKKVLFIIAILIVGTTFFIISGCVNDHFQMIKFPEPDGQTLGVIEHDFDGNGHHRYISRMEFMRRGLTEKDCRVTIIESTENSYYWINRLRGSKDESGNTAIWISKLEAVCATKVIWGHPDDHDKYTNWDHEYRDYTYDYQDDIVSNNIKITDL